MIALDRHTTGDGVVSALQVLQAVVRSGKSLATWLSDVTLFPQTLINVRLVPGQSWMDNQRLISTKTQVEKDLNGRGRILIRASGTEPLLRIMVEAEDATLAQNSAKRLVEAISA